MREFKSKKFTDQEIYAIKDMYLDGLSAKEMSERIGKSVNVGNLQVIRNWFGIKQNRSGGIMEQILASSGEIVKLAEEGYNSKDICLKLNLDPRCHASFKHWIPGLKTSFYHTYGPEIQSGVIHDYTVEFMSILEIGGKYKMDEASVQSILRRGGLLRNYLETRNLKNLNGKYNKAKKYNSKGDKTFSVQIRESVRTSFGSVCVCCNQSNEDHLKSTKRSLNVHHIYPYSACRENRIDNLIPLCAVCHKNVHKQMEKEKSIYKALGSHYRDGLDMSELFFDLFDTDRIADLKIASLDFGSA